MRIDVVRAGELGPGELATWRAFQRETPTLANAFLAPEFTLAVAAVNPRVRVAVLADGADTVGFLPFERRPLGRGVPVADGLTDAHGLVHAPDTTWDPRALLRGCGLSVLQFDHLVDGQKPFEPFQTVRAASPVMDLSAGYAAWRAEVRTRSRSLVSELERKRRGLDRRVGPVRFDFGGRAPEVLRTIVDWKSAQYRRTGRIDRFARPWIAALVTTLLEVESPTFTPVLSMLWAGDVPVAGHFGLRLGGALAGWFPAYDPAFSRWSPGLLHHLMLAEAAAADGVTEIDMGRGAQGYKSAFRSRDVVVAEGRVTRPGPGAAAAWLQREPVRALRRHVLADPRLYRAADRVLRGYARARGRVSRPAV